MLLSVLRFKFDMPYNLRVIGISYKLQLTSHGGNLLPILAEGSRVAASLDAGIADLRSRDKAVVNGRCHEIQSPPSVRVAPQRISRRRKVRRPVQIIAPVHKTGSPRVVNRPCPPLKLGSGVATYCRGQAPRDNMRGRQIALESEADEVEEIHTITLIMQLRLV